MLIGLALLAALAGHTALWPIVVLLPLIGVGTVMFDVANHGALLGVVDRERLASANASMATFAHLGIATGVALGGAVYTARSMSHTRILSGGGLDSATVAAQSSQAAFGDTAALLAGLLVVTAIVAAFRGRT